MAGYRGIPQTARELCKGLLKLERQRIMMVSTRRLNKPLETTMAIGRTIMATLPQQRARQTQALMATRRYSHQCRHSVRTQISAEAPFVNPIQPSTTSKLPDQTKTSETHLTLTSFSMILPQLLETILTCKLDRKSVV